MNSIQYQQELNEIKAELVASAPSGDSEDFEEAFDRHQRKLAILQKFFDAEVHPPNMLVCTEPLYGYDSEIMRLLQMLNAVDL